MVQNDIIPLLVLTDKTVAHVSEFCCNSQASSPACTELEVIVMDWLGKMIGLPDDFLHSASKSEGGGVIQTTASESTFVCLLAGRTEAIRRYVGTSIWR